MNKFRPLLTSTLALLVVFETAAFAQGRGGRGASAGPSPTFKSTLKPVTSAETTPDGQGFIPRWGILDPIAIGNQQTESASKAVVKTEHFPEQWTVVPKDGDKVTVGGNELTWRAVDTINYNVNLYHFAYAQGKSSAGALFWVVTVVNCPQDTPNVRLAVGSNASSIWWVNGKEVVGIYGDIQTVIDDGVSRPLTLKKGANIIRGAIINGSGASDFCARFLDAHDKPLKGFTVSAGNTK
jgi:hypothetical protein